jgi:hypothetical protein
MVAADSAECRDSLEATMAIMIIAVRCLLPGSDSCHAAGGDNFSALF